MIRFSLCTALSVVVSGMTAVSFVGRQSLLTDWKRNNDSGSEIGLDM
jgi:hypothetical protein